MFSRRIDRLSGSLIREILQLAQQPEMISFAGGLPAGEVMPGLDFSAAPESIRQYGATEGEPHLRELIAQRLCGLGRECTPEQVLVTAGSQQGIDLAAKLFIDEGTPVAVEAPTYLAAAQSFRLFGAEFDELPLSPAGIAPHDLERTIAKRRPAFAYLIPNFQNPTGYCYAAENRREIAAVLDRHKIPLVEDEPYRDLAYDASAERTPIFARLRRAPWVYLGSFSKTACPGLRIGFLASSPELFPYFVRLKQATDLHTNRLGQWWVADHLGRTGNDLEQLTNYYRDQRDAMHAALLENFTDLSEWTRPGGGLFFWVRLKRTRDTRPLLSQALERKVAFMPGEAFFANPVAQAGALRLNFSHAKPDRIAQGIAILAEVIRNGASS